MHFSIEIYAAAKETVCLAEQRFMSNSHEWQFDNAWQEMLNHATIKVIYIICMHILRWYNNCDFVILIGDGCRKAKNRKPCRASSESRHFQCSRAKGTHLHYLHLSCCTDLGS